MELFPHQGPREAKLGFACRRAAKVIRGWELGGKTFFDEKSGIMRLGGSRAIEIIVRGREDLILCKIKPASLQKVQNTFPEMDSAKVKLALAPPELDEEEEDDGSWV